MTERAVSVPRRPPAPHESLEQFLPYLYETALTGNPARWDEVLGALGRLFDAEVVGIATVDKLMGQPLLIRWSGISPDILSNWHFRAEEDPLFQFSRQDSSDDFIVRKGWMSVEEYHRAPIYGALIEPSGLDDFLLARFESTPLIFSSLAVFRRAGRTPFGAHETELLTQLAPHLKAAVRVARRLSQADGATRASVATLEFSRHGIVLLDRAGTILFMNDEARRITGSRDGIAVRHHRLRFGDEAAQRSLQGLIERPDVEGRRRRIEEGRLRARRHSEGLPYEVVVVAVDQRWSDIHYFRDGSAFLVLISDPGEVFSVPRRLLIDTYGLSVNQARLCQALLRAGSLEDAARGMGIRPHSARTHLRRTFAKLGVSSQLELVLLLGATIRGPDGAGPAGGRRSA